MFIHVSKQALVSELFAIFVPVGLGIVLQKYAKYCRTRYSFVKYCCRTRLSPRFGLDQCFDVGLGMVPPSVYYLHVIF